MGGHHRRLRCDGTPHPGADAPGGAGEEPLEPAPDPQVAISVGVLFSIAQFWYSLIYLPTTAPASLTLEAKLDKVTPRGKHVVIEVRW